MQRPWRSLCSLSALVLCLTFIMCLLLLSRGYSYNKTKIKHFCLGVSKQGSPQNFSEYFHFLFAYFILLLAMAI